MTKTLIDGPDRQTQAEYLRVLRKAEIEKLEGSPSFEQFLPMASDVVPAYQYQFDTVDDDIVVEISRHGENEGRPANESRKRESVDLHFFVTKMAQDAMREWMMEQRKSGSLPVPTQERNDRLVRSVINHIHLEMDDYMWGGNNKFGITGLVNEDSTPDAMTNPLSLASGRTEFVEAIATAFEEIKALTSRKHRIAHQGTPILAIDDSLLMWMSFPYETGGQGAGGPTLADMIQKTGVRILPVGTTQLTGKAVLHWAHPDNAELLLATNQGVSTVWGWDGGNKTQKIFHLGSYVAHRPELFRTFTALT